MAALYLTAGGSPSFQLRRSLKGILQELRCYKTSPAKASHPRISGAGPGTPIEVRFFDLTAMLAPIQNQGRSGVARCPFREITFQPSAFYLLVLAFYPLDEAMSKHVRDESKEFCGGDISPLRGARVGINIQL